MIVSELGLSPTALQDEIAIVTGAGGGIGYEAVRSPLWLGTNVIIAEIYKTGGERPARLLTDEFGALEHHHVMDKKPYAFRWTIQAIIMVWRVVFLPRQARQSRSHRIQRGAPIARLASHSEGL